MTVYWLVLAGLAYFLLMAAIPRPAFANRSLAGSADAGSSRLFLGAAALVLILVAGLRWRVGTDFGQYVLNYEAYKISFWADLRTFNEPGAKGLAFATSHVFDDPILFTFAASALTIGLMLRTITKYTISIATSYLLFVFTGLWHGSFNGIRQYLALAVIMAGHRLIVDRKPLHYALVVLLAATFHLSALAMILLYFVPSRKLTARMVALLAAGAVLAVYFSGYVMEFIAFVSVEDLRFTDYVTTAVNPLRIAVSVAPLLLYWTFGVRTAADGEWFYRNMGVVNAAVWVAVSSSAYLARFGIYTMAFLPLVVPRLIDFSDRRLTLLARMSAVLLYGAFWYVDVSSSEALNNFQFVFQR